MVDRSRWYSPTPTEISLESNEPIRAPSSSTCATGHVLDLRQRDALTDAMTVPESVVVHALTMGNPLREE